MANIPISSLPEVTSVTDNDYLAVDDGTTSSKIKIGKFNESATASAQAYAEAAATSAGLAEDYKDAAQTAKSETQNLITSAQTIVSDAQTYAGNAQTSENNASTYANNASNSASAAATSALQASTYAQGVDAYATEAKSWAQGGTGTRSGEDTDNAKYYSNLAHTYEQDASSAASAASGSASDASDSKDAASGSATSASASALVAEGYATGKQNGEAVSSGAYYHNNAAYYADQASASATSASNQADRAETAVVKEPYIGANNNWFVWDWDSNEYVDTEIEATGPEGDQGPAGNGIVSITKTSTSGLVDTYTILYTNGNTDTLTVTNGQNGTGSGDMLKSEYDSTNAVHDAGGIVAYVSNQLSGFSTNLSGLSDVDLTSLAAGQTLTYDATTQKWVNTSLGSAAALNVPASGDASTTEVVKGDDSRLTDARTPVSHTHTKSEITDFPSLGTAAAKDSTNAVTENSTDLVESGAVYTEVSALNTAIAAKADASDLTDLEDNLTGTVSNNDLYVLRQGKGSLVDMNLIGGTVAWNQLVPTRINTSAANSYPFTQGAQIVAGHKYLYAAKFANNTQTASVTIYMGKSGSQTEIVSQLTRSMESPILIFAATKSGISDGTATISEGNFWVYTYVVNANNTISDVNLIDLTQMFGTTIADYIYSLEQANAGDGVAWFRNYFPKAYYAYDAGQLLSVKPSGRKVYDSNNDLLVSYSMPETEIRGVYSLDANNKLTVDGDIYKSDGSVTRKYGIVDLGTLTWSKVTGDTPYFYAVPANVKTSSAKQICAKYVSVSSYNTMLATNMSCFQNSNGTFMVHDDSLSSGDATAFKTAMSGVYLAYELAASTTETVAGYANPQRSDVEGTEEWIDSRDVVVPVGNDSTYYLNDTYPPIAAYADGLNRELTEVTSDSDGYASYSKVGKVVICTIYANSVTVTSGAVISNIPSGFEPVQDVYGIEINSKSAMPVSRADKWIKLTNGVTNANIRGTIVWLTA